MNEDNNKKLESAVMGKIKNGQIKLKSKYIFLAEKLGLGTALTLSFVLAALLFNLFLFYIKETDNLKYLTFGRDGIFAFLESFPYPIVIIFILVLVLVSYLIKKSDTLYKRSFSHIIVFLIISITFFGAVLTYTSVAERIEGASFRNDYPGKFLRPLMAPPEIRDKGVAGIVYEKGKGYLIVKTPNGLRSVNVEKIDNKFIADLSTGKFIISVGERDGKNFIAYQLKVFERNEIPSVERGISQKFNQFEGKFDQACQRELPSDIMYFEEKEKKCIQDCLNSGECVRDCFPRCIEKKDR